MQYETYMSSVELREQQQEFTMPVLQRLFSFILTDMSCHISYNHLLPELIISQYVTDNLSIDSH